MKKNTAVYHYVDEIINIDTAETYMIASDKVQTFANDTTALRAFFSEKSIKSGLWKETILYYHEICHLYHCYPLRLGIAERIFSKDRIFYLPVLCMEIDGVYHHVEYHNNWLCLDCRRTCPVFLHLPDSEHMLYQDPFSVERPKQFQHITCQQCGHLLQGYLLPADEIS